MSELYRLLMQMIGHIHMLTEELLCMIFDHLDLRSVMNASRTCKRWNNIIFGSGYVNKFSLSIRDSLIPPGSPWISNGADAPEPQMDPLTMEQFRDMVAQSQRCYRNLKCTMENGDRFSSLWETVHPKVTNNIQSLVLEGSFYGSNVLPLITEAIPLMSQLHSLTLVGWVSDKSARDVDIPTFRSNSVKHFEMHSDMKMKIEMPELESFHGVLPINFISSNLSNLKQLTAKMITENFPGQHMKPIDTRNIRRLTHLETLKWEIDADDHSFLAICETCTMLKELSFPKQLAICDEDVFNTINKLVNLRSLKFRKLLVLGRFFTDLSKLTKLEEIEAGSVGRNGLKVPKSTKMLAVEVNQDNYERLYDTIFRIWPENILIFDIRPENILIELKTLKISFCIQFRYIKEFSDSLSRLKNLEVLIFAGGNYDKSFFQCMDKMDSLRKLKFEGCILEEERFDGIEEKFPNLKHLEFLDNRVSRGGAYKPHAQQNRCLGMLPECIACIARSA